MPLKYQSTRTAACSRLYIANSRFQLAIPPLEPES